MAFRELSKNLTTLAYTANQTVQMNLTGQGNKVVFSLDGTVSNSTTCVQTYGDACLFISNFKMQVAQEDGKTYKPFDVNGYTLYAISKCFYATPGLRTCANSSTSQTHVGFEFALPIGNSQGKSTITVSVKWGALTDAGTNITAYTGILTAQITQDQTPGLHKFGFIDQPLGNSGVIATTGTVQPTMPTLEHHKFCGEIITYCTSGPALADGLSNIRVDEKSGVTILDVNGYFAKVMSQDLCFNAPPTGVYMTTHKPIDISTSTQIQLIATTASVASSMLTFMYLLEGSGTPQGVSVTSQKQGPTVTPPSRNPGAGLRSPN